MDQSIYPSISPPHKSSAVATGRLYPDLHEILYPQLDHTPGSQSASGGTFKPSSSERQSLFYNEGQPSPRSVFQIPATLSIVGESGDEMIDEASQITRAIAVTTIANKFEAGNHEESHTLTKDEHAPPRRSGRVLAQGQGEQSASDIQRQKAVEEDKRKQRSTQGVYNPCGCC